MEIKPSDIKDGQVFYGVDLSSTFPSFNKFTCIKATAKQVKAQKVISYASSYEYTLRAGTWRFFADFASARDLWVIRKVDKDIERAKTALVNAEALREELLTATDI